MFRHMPFMMLALIALIIFAGTELPLGFKQYAYAISLSIHSAIIALLPLIIFSLLFKTLIDLPRRNIYVIGLILIAVCCSNVTSTFLSHYVGAWLYQHQVALINPHAKNELTPAFLFTFPKLLNNDKAMLLGMLFGIIFKFYFNALGKLLALRLHFLASKLLHSIIYLIPLFVSGFMIKLQADDMLGTIIRDYSVIFIYIALAQFSYIIFIYALLSRFHWQIFLKLFKNMLPAGLIGLTTMSSAVAMPLTIIAAKNNAQNKDLAAALIPATVNIHLIGDCFAIPILAYAVMKSFGVAEPSLLTYLQFLSFFVIAKFSVAAVPAGGILVMLPILEKYLGFNASMLSLITALYILFDPVITCANVFGNGGFAKFIDYFYRSSTAMDTPALQDK